MRQLFIDMLDGEGKPKPGDYVVSVGKRGIGTIYQVCESRQVRRRDPAACPRFVLRVEAKSSIERSSSTEVFEFKWYPRKKRKLRFEDFMRRKV